MLQNVYRQKRKVNGKRVKARIYRGRYRLPGESKITDITLETSDKESAIRKLDQIVKEKEQEAAGILAPKTLRDAATRPLSEHVTQYCDDLRVRRRDEMYVYNVEKELNRLFAECGWRYIKDITPDSFRAWRCRQSSAPKTLNGYLAAASAFLQWMKKYGRIVANPLYNIDKVETRGYERRKRRALTHDEVRRLLSVSGRRAVLYLTALLTGLRRGELQGLIWDDVQLDGLKPYLRVRASTTKNHKDVVIVLHPELAAQLRVLRPESATGSDQVFEQLPRMEQFRADLEAAGIPYFDSQGHQADFHALRHTFATNLARAGIAPRIAMELMRHSDMRLTTKTYTDASQLPTADAIKSLPGYLGSVPEESTQKTHERHSHDSGVTSHAVTSPVTPCEEVDAMQLVENESESQSQACSVTPGHKEAIGCRTRIRT